MKPSNGYDKHWYAGRIARLNDVEIDRRILQESDPFCIEGFRWYMEYYLEYWCNRPVIRKYSKDGYQEVGIGPGCMVCGQDSPVSLFIVKERQLPAHSYLRTFTELHIWDSLSQGYKMEVAPLHTYYQALWRIHPEGYFAYMSFFPLKGMPLLVLCATCADLLCKDSHDKIVKGRNELIAE